MSDVSFSRGRYGGPGPETYERFFVPHIGRPIATALVKDAGLRLDECVLDVGCGTGILTRLARERIGDARLAALDPNPDMLAVARSVAGDLGIEWHQASAESMPLEDGAFDVVLSQMALQFVPDKRAALEEIARVLAPGGRVVLNVVGPRPEPFRIFAEALASHIGPDSAKFVDAVFSLHDPDELKTLVEGADLRTVDIQSRTQSLSLPDPEESLWGYVDSTPLSAVVRSASEDAKRALHEDVVRKWRAHVANERLVVEVPVVTVMAET